MDQAAPRLIDATVMHRRLRPIDSAFAHSAGYLHVPLECVEDGRLSKLIAVNRLAPLSFWERDHGGKDGGSLLGWARSVLSGRGIHDVEGVALVCMPRMLGYVFNPVSFWLCHRPDGLLRAVICEVNNTFGETHSYLCARRDGGPIASSDWLEADKLFHVSPFLERSGRYRFRFSLGGESCKVWIDYHSADGARTLATSVTGKFRALTRASARRFFWRHFMRTFKVTALIHLHALRLAARGLKYRVKPAQKPERISQTDR